MNYYSGKPKSLKIVAVLCVFMALIIGVGSLSALADNPDDVSMASGALADISVAESEVSLPRAAAPESVVPEQPAASFEEQISVSSESAAPETESSPEILSAVTESAAVSSSDVQDTQVQESQPASIEPEAGSLMEAAEEKFFDVTFLSETGKIISSVQVQENAKLEDKDIPSMGKGFSGWYNVDVAAKITAAQAQYTADMQAYEKSLNSENGKGEETNPPKALDLADFGAPADFTKPVIENWQLQAVNLPAAAVQLVSPLAVTEVDVANVTDLTNAVNRINLGEEIVIKLKNNININSPITVKGNLIIVPDGGNLIYQDSDDKRHFIIEPDNKDIVIDMDGVTLEGIDYGDMGGGGLQVQGPGTVSYNGGTITNCYGDLGGAIQINGTNFVINKGVFTHNHAQLGGNIYFEGSSFTMAGGEVSFSDNSFFIPSEKGGGMYIKNGSFTMSGGTITENYGDIGGGVYLLNSTATITGGEIAANRSGGEIYADDSQVVLGGTASVYDNVTTGAGGGVNLINTSSLKFGGNAVLSANKAKYGLAISADDSSVEINGGKITNNTIGQYGTVRVQNGGSLIMTAGEISGNEISCGGGVSLVNSDFTMSGGLISGNQAAGVGDANGGGVEVTEGSGFIMTGGIISGNNALYSGGGVYVTGADSTFNLSGDGKITGNTSHDSWISAGGNIALTDSAVFEMTGGEISYGVSVDGGGVSAKNGSTVTLTGGVISNNRAETINSNTLNSYGGGVSVRDGVFNMGGNAVVSQNETLKKFSNDTVYGAGIYIEASDTTFSGSAAIMSNNGDTGGGAYIVSSPVDISGNVSFTGNTARVSAAIAFDYNKIKYPGKITVATIHNGKFSGNTSKANGIVTVGLECELTMEDGEISGNTMSSGAVFTSSSATFNMRGGTIKNNTAVDGVTPTALTSGAGINLNGGNFYMTGGSITDNTCTSVGGGIQLVGAGHIEISGNSLVSGNKAAYGGGIALYNTPATGLVSEFIMTGGEISGNIATKSGGGIETGRLGAGAVNSFIDLRDGRIINNQAAMSGGGIALDYEWTMDMGNNVIISGNEAPSGGGVSVSNSAKFNLNGGTITNNQASLVGGGVYVTKTSDFNMAGGKITANDAIKEGGGLYVDIACPATISGGEITNNTAGTDGGAIYTKDYTKLQALAGTVFSNNFAAAGGYVMRDDDPLMQTYTTNITATQFTTPFVRGYNNYDINFVAGQRMVTVTFTAGQNGQIGTENVTCVVPEGTDFTDIIKPDTLPDEHYIFNGWVNTDGTPVSGVISENTTIEASFTGETNTVTFDGNANGVSGVPGPISIKWPVNRLPAWPANPTRPGYVFLGWNSKADGSGTTYTKDTPVTKTVTIYAQWKVEARTSSVVILPSSTSVKPASSSAKPASSSSSSSPTSNPPAPSSSISSRPDVSSRTVSSSVVSSRPASSSSAASSSSSVPPAASSSSVPPEPVNSTVDSDTTPTVVSPDAAMQEMFIAQQDKGIVSNVMNGNVPLGSFRTADAWGLFNLMLALASAGIAFASFMLYMLKKRSRMYLGSGEAVESHKYNSILIAVRSFGIVCGLMTGIIFLILENQNNPMVFINANTPVIFFIAVLQVAALIVIPPIKRARERDEQQLLLEKDKEISDWLDKS